MIVSEAPEPAAREEYSTMTEATPGTLSTLTNGYLLRDPETQAVFVAVADANDRPGGVMPHLAAGASVEVTGPTDDGGVTIVIRHDPNSPEMDQQMKAYPISDPVAGLLVAASGAS